jgi:ATP-dependent DNA ligase
MVKSRPNGYIPPCIPTRAYKVPTGPDWVHEIKHDGYRLQVRRDGDAVRLFTRRGYDWSGRYPAIAVTAMQLRARSFTLDGEAAFTVFGYPRCAHRLSQRIFRRKSCAS